jgi:hypothetical protein
MEIQVILGIICVIVVLMLLSPMGYEEVQCPSYSGQRCQCRKAGGSSSGRQQTEIADECWR